MLSPTLFNLLVEKLVTLIFKPNTKLFAYTDNLQLVATGSSWLVNSHAPDIIILKCNSLKLKINPAKTSALFTSENKPNMQLSLASQQLLWVDFAKCLGHISASGLHSSLQLKYIQQSTALRKLASTSGAGFKILRTFHIQPIRSIIDFSALSLLEPLPLEYTKLGCIQIEAMWTSFGAPRWTRLANLRAECNLVSLQLKIKQITAAYMAKSLTSDKPFVQRQSISTPNQTFPKHPQ